MHDTLARLEARAELLRRVILDEFKTGLPVDRDSVMRLRSRLEDTRILIGRLKGQPYAPAGALHALAQGRPSLALGSARW